MAERGVLVGDLPDRAAVRLEAAVRHPRPIGSLGRDAAGEVRVDRASDSSVR